MCDGIEGVLFCCLWWLEDDDMKRKSAAQRKQEEQKKQFEKLAATEMATASVPLPPFFMLRASEGNASAVRDAA